MRAPIDRRGLTSSLIEVLLVVIVLERAVTAGDDDLRVAIAVEIRDRAMSITRMLGEPWPSSVVSARSASAPLVIDHTRT